MIRLRQHAMLVLVCGAITGLVVACGGTSSLRAAAQNVAKAQGVEESSVLRALDSLATTEDEQLRLVRTWEAELTGTRIPNLGQVADDVDTFGDAAVQELRSSACEAVLDIIQTHQVPDARQFVEGYLQGLALHNVPSAEIATVAEQFGALVDEAIAGDVTYFDVRLTLMRFQYC